MKAIALILSIAFSGSPAFGHWGMEYLFHAEEIRELYTPEQRLKLLEDIKIKKERIYDPITEPVNILYALIYDKNGSTGDLTWNQKQAKEAIALISRRQEIIDELIHSHLLIDLRQNYIETGNATTFSFILLLEQAIQNTRSGNLPNRQELSSDERQLRELSFSTTQRLRLMNLHIAYLFIRHGFLPTHPLRDEEFKNLVRSEFLKRLQPFALQIALTPEFLFAINEPREQLSVYKQSGLSTFATNLLPQLASLKKLIDQENWVDAAAKLEATSKNVIESAYFKGLNDPCAQALTSHLPFSI